MSSKADSELPRTARRGFVLGELFVAIFLLALAISSVTALMYSVTRNPRARTPAECSDKAAASEPRCRGMVKAKAKATANARTASGRSKESSTATLLVAGCATRTAGRVQACEDSVLARQEPNATTLRSRTDSASLKLLPKKIKRESRPDLGFVR